MYLHVGLKLDESIAVKNVDTSEGDNQILEEHILRKEWYLGTRMSEAIWERIRLLLRKEINHGIMVFQDQKYEMKNTQIGKAELHLLELDYGNVISILCGVRGFLTEIILPVFYVVKKAILKPTIIQNHFTKLEMNIISRITKKHYNVMNFGT